MKKMKKIVRLTESDLVRLVNRVIKEQVVPKKPIKNTPSKFKAEATVEGDMVMSFYVTQFDEILNWGIGMNIYDEHEKRNLFVRNFKGPIYDENGKKVYTDSQFNNIDSKNWKQIAQRYNIPTVMD